MKNTRIKILILLMIISLIVIIKPIESDAAGLTVSASNTNPEVGSNITLTIGSGIGGKVSIKSSNSNVISVPSTTFIDYNSTSLSLNAKSVGTTTITVTCQDVVTTDAEPKQVTGSKSVTINVKEKKKTTSTSKEPTDTSNSSSKKLPASNKSNTNKEKVKNIEETEQKEEATPQFGMNSLMLTGVKENEEKQEIIFTPTFNIDIYEYTCNITSDIKDIEVATEAGEYNDYVKIEKPEEFIEGENIIKITMTKDDMSLTYTIKVIKEKNSEVEGNIENKENETQKTEPILIFSMPQFIGIIIAICLIEGVILKMPWKKLFRRKKDSYYDNNDL